MADEIVKPGEIRPIDEPEQFGRFPVRTELTVLPADPEHEPLGFTFKCHEGSEVFLLDDTGMPVEVPLTTKESLYPGLEICAPTLFGPIRATVREEDGDLYWESEDNIGDLVFDNDDRHAWVSTNAINKRLLKNTPPPV